MASITEIMQAFSQGVNSYGQNDPYYMVRQSQRMGEPISLVDAQNILSKRQEQQQQAAIQQAMPQIAQMIDPKNPNASVAKLLQMGIEPNVAMGMVKMAIESADTAQSDALKQQLLGGTGSGSDLTNMPLEDLSKLLVASPEMKDVVNAEFKRREIESSAVKDKKSFEAQQFGAIQQDYAKTIETPLGRIQDYNNAVDFAKQNDGAADYQLIKLAVQANDKRASAVTDSEFGIMQSTGSLPERIKRTIGGYQAGQKLTPVQRGELLKVIKTMAGESKKIIDNVDKTYQKRAEKSGLDFNEIKSGFDATVKEDSINIPQGARKAPDGNYYMPDPKRPGKYLKVVQ